MSEPKSEQKLRDYLKRVTLDLRKARRDLRELEQSRHEPIAIVGMSCRYPGGASSPEGLWEVLARGVDAIGGFPEDRGWSSEVHDGAGLERGAYTKEGGFLYEAAEFDAGFFGISPREALGMDPQQRLLLETCWEACEHAAVDPHALRGSSTGMFAGVCSYGYGGDAFEREDLQGYRLTGTACSVASGRVAYVLGLEGPAISIDTACSSSLVALHIACQALRREECSMAFAGGATVMAGPELFLDVSRQRGLASDARCKAFADSASGTAWGEGVGVLLLERLSDARRLGHRVLAVVRGTAVNQDGASNGLSAPNGPSQRRVIQSALDDAQLAAIDVDAVEAHGTGTRLGDPIEAQALLGTYGVRPPEHPLWLGSVKSNIGHTQAAAGVAGVIKMVLALQHELLPKTLHIDKPSSQVDWSAGAVELLTQERPWPAGDVTRRAGVSSFAVSGTNAHVILEEAPPNPSESELADRHRRPVLGQIDACVLSARDTASLIAQAERLEPHLGEEHNLKAVQAALAKRPVLERRAVVLAGSREDLRDALPAVGKGEGTAALVEGTARKGQTVFVFPGHGSQWDGMALELLQCAPVFAEQMQACEAALSEHVDWSLHDVLRGSEGAPKLERVDVVQPVLFAVMVSLAALWRACGVHPAAVVGQSQGEIAAAHVAGGLSLADAARVVVLRSRILMGIMGEGALLSAAAPLALVEEMIEPWADRLFVGGVTGPNSVTVVGEEPELKELLAQFELAGIRARQMPMSLASHSPQVEPLREELLAALSDIAPCSGDMVFYSTVTGEPFDMSGLDAKYWFRNMREPVRFEAAVRKLLTGRARVLVEVSPHPVLTMGIQETIDVVSGEHSAKDGLGGDALVASASAIASLRRGEGERERFVKSLSEAWAQGAQVDWSALHGELPEEHVPLPTYPFQRRHYWLEAPRVGDAGALGQTRSEHPMLGAAVALADDEGWLFTGRLSMQSHPWLADHAVMGNVLLPGAALLELALHAGARAGCEQVQELILEAPLLLSERSALQLQISVGAPDGVGRRPVQIHARPEAFAEEDFDSSQSWTRHASGWLASRLAEPGLDANAQSLSGVWPPPGAIPTSIDDLYETLAENGVEYGQAFQGLRAAWRLGNELLAEVSLPEEQETQAGQYAIHPALLDAALHAAALVDGHDKSDGSSVMLPFSWRGVRTDRAGARELRVRISRRGVDAISLLAADGDGAPVLEIESLLLRPMSEEGLRPTGMGANRSLFRVRWKPLPTDAGPTEERWAALGDLDPRLSESLQAGGVSVERYADLGSLSKASNDDLALPNVVLWEHTPDVGEDLAGAVRAGANAALEFVQAWLAEDRALAPRLVLLTRGAVAIREGDQVPGLADSAIWGLVRSAQAENPGRLLLLDSDEHESSHAALAVAVVSALAEGEPQVALREGISYVPRLLRGAQASAAYSPSVEGTVLITGGVGRLGSLLARHLIEAHGVKDLVLTSRKGLKAPGAQDLQAELSALGAGVRIVKCDVSQRAQLQETLASIAAEGRLSGVVHAAGVLDDGTFASLSSERLDRVLEPKVDGAIHLHELTQGLGLDMFVLFSSVAGVFGASGQANYAAANAFLDALAAHRRAQGLPASSIAWGLWEQIGEMAEHLSDLDLARMRRSGIQALSTQEGLELYDGAYQASDPLAVAVRLDMSALRSQGKSGLLSPLFGELIQVSSARVSQQAAGGSLARRLAGLDEDGRSAAVLEFVCAQAAGVLGHDSAGAIDPTRPFKEFGFDSLLAVDLRNRLNSATGMGLPATLAFDHPSAQSVADYLIAQLADRPLSQSAPHAAARSVEEPLAIVGMSCRYPGGVSSPQQLWDLLAAGGDAISAFPTDRGWDQSALHGDLEHPGASHAREGGFLYDATEFDAGFFAIGPREALAMDPQQRLLLEVSWEALESAGLDPLSLKGSPTGVFAGVSSIDYGAGGREVGVAQGYGLTGASGSVLSGRVSYSLGLEGPALTVDTACSSSLVSIHLACQSLRAGECSLALAGGVTVLSSPDMFVEFSHQRGLAPDGRCKSFADNADGVGLAEGVGVVVLERLSEARRLGHTVLGLVRGSAVNQDGASNGLSAPNGPSQQRVILQALANAGLEPHEVDVVEAHGTGTVLGDPIEAQAVLATYGKDRPVGRPLRLGSIKSNIGHTQAAAGVAGVIKMAMAFREGVLPKTLHVEAPSSRVDWSEGSVELLTEALPWASEQGPRRAGISSFGIGGTNAHLILEAPTAADESAGAQASESSGPGLGATASDPDPPSEPDSGSVVWLLSAKDERALRAQAERLADHVSSHQELRLSDVALSLTRRSALEARAAVVGADRAEMLAGLQAIATGQSQSGVSQGTAVPASALGGLAFLFSGQGSQRLGMGWELFEAFPVFHEAFEQVREHLDPLLDTPLLDVMLAPEGSPQALLLDDTTFAQPAIFALEVALFAQLRSLGLRPDFLIGHSVGELAAAHVAGVLSLSDACRLVAGRGRLMGALAPGGAMVAIQASEQELLGSLAGFERQASIAAVNGPSSAVLSGERDLIERIAGEWERQGRKVRRLTVSHAFHSPLMDGMLDELVELAGGLSFGPPSIPIVSNVTGKPISAESLSDSSYWREQARQTVRFADGVSWLATQGVRRFLELGPDAVLCSMCQENLGQANALVVPALRRGRSEQSQLFGALAAVWVDGTKVAWEAICDRPPARPVELPTYAFQRERYWPIATTSSGTNAPTSAGEAEQTSRATDRSLLSLDWRAIQAQPTPVVGGPWALVGAADRSVIEALSAAGTSVQAHPDLASLLASSAPGEEMPELVLLECDFDGSDESTLAQEDQGSAVVSVHATVRAALGLLQQWLAEPRLAASRCVLITRGACAAVANDRVPSMSYAALAGLVRCAQLENPGRILLLDADPQARDWRELPAAIAGALGSEEPQVALRDRAIFAPRLHMAASLSEAPSSSRSVFGEQGTTLITGGTGALGVILARHLVSEHGVRNLMLVSRSGLERSGVPELCEELAELGAEVQVLACDVADRAQVEHLIDSVPEGAPLRAVVHTAAIVEDGVIGSLTPESVDRVLDSKLDGAFHLHELTKGLGLSAFVLFSSIAGTLGSPGQGNYAAANAALDALATARRAQGLPGVSIAWGLWDGAAGLASSLAERDLARIESGAIRPLTREEGLKLFDEACLGEEACVVAARLDRPTLRSRAINGTLPPVLRGLASVDVDGSAGESGASLRRRLADVSQGEREAIVLELVRSEAAAALGHSSPEKIPPRKAFKQLGFDSLAAVELRNRLDLATGVRLAATLVFDYPDAASLTEYLLGELTEQGVAARGVSVAVREDEPIAIVGMACRYPGGVCSPEQLWELVASGTDAISPFPEDRGWDLEWLGDPERSGSSYSNEGGFVLDAGGFDEAFFAVSPREALRMDPQQRLLLEASWEALEDAGIDPNALRGSQTGVFAGVMYEDYGSGVPEPTADGSGGHVGTGSSASVVSGRVAYTLGLQGPTLSVNTACSSSLVASHLACQALRAGECSLALVGGVTVMWMPTAFVEFSRQRGLARDGRCKSYSESADGTGWGEGVGMLVLERLSEAKRNGRSVLALIKGSAVNQDGASNGLTAPNGPSQQQVIGQALASARLSPQDIDAVEGHGTGTTLGDPIEAQALLAAYGQDRQPESPLWLGSIKSNIGHTQAAAGVAGVIKMVMAMRAGVLPPTLHVDRPSSQVDWSAGAVELLTEAVSWPARERPRRAGVSSFGFSGTNAHLILEEAPPLEVSSREEMVDVGGAGDASDHKQGSTGGEAPVEGELGPVPWVLSAAHPDALDEQARRLAEHVANREDLDLGDVGYSLACRPTMERRAVVLSSEREGLLAGLRALSRGGGTADTISGLPVHELGQGAGPVAFLFTGQGSQRVGMGRGLHRQFESYRQAFDDACAHLSEHLGGSVEAVVLGEATGAAPKHRGTSKNGTNPIRPGTLDHTAFAQAGLFALEVALFRLLESYGVKPDFLLGHSVGELVAAHVSGVLSLEDACKLVAARGQLMGELPTGGAMVAVQASEQEVLQTLEGLEDRVALAAVNGPASVVFSGEEDAVLELGSLWERRSRKTKRLLVSHAFHSARMDGMLERFAEIAAGMSYAPPQIPIVSNLTGEPVRIEEISTPEYWVRHARETVRFGEGIAWLGQQGVRSFIELGPEGVLSAMAHDTLGQDALAQVEEQGTGIFAASLLRGERPEVQTFMGVLAEAFVAGVEVDWAATLSAQGAHRVKLPTYAFQRRRYWLTPQAGPSDVVALGQRSAGHPLLSAAVELAGEQGGVFTGRLSLATHPWLADHAVMGVVLLPGTAYVDLALHVGGILGVEFLSELTLEAPLVIEEHAALMLQVSVGELDQSGQRALEIYSRPAEAFAGEPWEQAWTRHATGTLAPVGAARDPEVQQAQVGPLLEGWPPPGAESLELEDLYGRLAESGLDYGEVFQGLAGAWRRGEDLFAEVTLAEAEHAQAAGFAIHPALLDAAFHALIDDGMKATEEEPSPVRLPFSFAGVGLGLAGASTLRVRLFAGLADTVSLTATDELGTPALWIDSLVARPVSQEQLTLARSAQHDPLLRCAWVEVPLEDNRRRMRRWALLGEDREGLLGALAEAGIALESYPSVASLEERAAREEPLPEIVLLDCAFSPGAEHLLEAMHGAVYRVQEVLREWLLQERVHEGKLVVLTKGALLTTPQEDVEALADSALWGLVQSAQAESPGRFVLVDHDGKQSSWSALSSALDGDEPRLALRAGRVLVPRLERLARRPAQAGQAGSQAGADGRAFEAEKTVLITGGTGGLGALLARHLVSEHGVRDLLLTSRSGSRALGALELQAELAAMGARVSIAACDVAVRGELEGLLSSINQDHPLGAVVHAAATMDNGLLETLTPERIGSVLGAKADGGWHLHELTAHMELSAFVLFSSIAGLFGGPGQGSYAAANVFLDRLAEYRRKQGLVGTSIVWGLWGEAGGGTQLGAAELRRVVGSASMRTLSSARGLELFDLAVAGEEAMVLATQLEMSALRREAREGTIVPLLRGLVRAPAGSRSAPDSGALARQLAGMAEEERSEALLQAVRVESARILCLPSPKAVAPARPFKEFGFDSLAAVELRNRLGVLLGMRLAATIVFDHPTPRELAQHLLGELDRDPSTAVSVDHVLDEIERMVSEVAQQQMGRRQAASRLRSWLSMLDSGDAEADLDSASDEEMFEILDTELGAL